MFGLCHADSQNSIFQCSSVIFISGHTNVALLLIQSGAELNLTDKNSQSALHLACFYGKEEMTSLLVQSGCDIDLHDSQGQTPIDVAMEMGNTDTAQLLRKHQKIPPVRHSDVKISVKRGVSPEKIAGQSAEKLPKGGISKTSKDGSDGSGPSQRSKSSKSSRNSDGASENKIDGTEPDLEENTKRRKSKRKFGRNIDEKMHRSSGKKRQKSKKKRESMEMSETATKKCCVIS